MFLKNPHLHVFAILALLTLGACDNRFSCSTKETQSILDKTNALLKKELQVQEDVFNKSILTIENDHIKINQPHLDDAITEKFITYRADMHSSEEAKKKYLERWKDKKPSTSVILEASIKMMQDKENKSPSCSFIKVTSESSGKGFKIISLV
jgi:hypothetical protein